MEKYIVTGMTCAACQARVEKAVSSVNGVTSCAVSLLTNSMGVEGTAKESEIIKAVNDAGYGIKKAGQEKENTNQLEESLKDTETPKLKKRLIYSVIFVLILMYFSMGHTMLNFPLPKFFNDNHVAIGLIQMLLALIVMVINQKFFINGFKGLIHKSPNMDTLVALGSSASFIWSTIELFQMTRATVDGNMDFVMDLIMNLYFESAAMILALITVGKMLEAKSKGKTTDALKSLMKLAPKTATILKDDKETIVDISDVNIDDIFIVKPGENIPVDGVVIEGESAVNESALTGESIPVDKEIGSLVSAATINQSGYLKARATRVGEDTTLSQIIQMVADSAQTKAPIAKVADKVSGVFVPVVISISLVTFIIWLLLGNTISYSLARAISVLVISCPCALGLATPVSIMVGNGLGAKNGLLFKTSQSLEETGKAQIIALDKTGTITKGEPEVTDIFTNGDISEEELLTIAYSLEKKSEHPLSKAIVKYSEERNIKEINIENFKSISGNGLSAVLNGSIIETGNLKFISKNVKVDYIFEEKANAFSESGKTPLFFRKDDKLIGIIAVSDVIKEDAIKAIAELKNMGLHTVMLTGDNKKTAKAIADIVKVDEVISDVLPSGKENIIRKLKEHGKVIMVGDGINDAPSLTSADIGIAIGAGTDVAIDAASVVLMKSNLSDVPKAIRLSRKTLNNIYGNLFWAFIYNTIGIPLAAGLFIKPLGLTLNPMFGAAAMSLSSFFVVSNALRLNLFKLNDSSKDKLIKNSINYTIINQEEKGENKMAVILKVEGMMCMHCEANVKKAVEAMAPGIEAVSDHVNGTVTVTGADNITEEEFKKVIEDKGYEFKGILK